VLSAFVFHFQLEQSIALCILLLLGEVLSHSVHIEQELSEEFHYFYVHGISELLVRLLLFLIIDERIRK
jgi:hypothetical protein